MDDDSNARAYLSGYADGEGCFCVSFNRSKRHRFGWEIRPSFSVSQNGDRAEVLEHFQRMLGCGSLRPDRSDKTIKFEARSVSDLATRILPHFERYPLLSSKQKDFEKFAAIVPLMHEGAHLHPDGFTKIVDLAAALNASSKKRFDRTAIAPELNV
jgi:LAGLIDADG DNA endonuclease family protein